ncbi:MAG: NPCBM/NEW2 domain-containing protein [Phycisphaerae bacterium]|nr:NPCBM/NEW2 domain-containing protein [Phycisphaerae bacterium]
MKKRYYLFLCLLLLVINVSRAESVRLSELDLSSFTQDWSEPQKDKSVGGNALTIGGKVYVHGVGTHANSSCDIDLFGRATSFEAFVGIDEESGKLGTVEFIVMLDDKEAYRSGVIKGSQPAKKVKLNLIGKKKMTLIVTTAGDDDRYDHANWAEAVISYNGKRPKTVSESYDFPPVKEAPGGPENAAAKLKLGKENKSFTLNYNNYTLLEADFDNEVKLSTSVVGENAIEQRIKIDFDQPTRFKAVINASSEALAAETRGSAQSNFALVRTSHGLSNNLRNNAVYDRNLDWMLEAPEGTLIKSSLNADGTTRFELIITTANAELIFRPRYYQKHKNLPYFQPWTYSIRKDSISGWCSWWAYMRNCRQEHVDAVMDVWQQKNLGDFGYRFIQLDDVYQGGSDGNRKIPENAMRNYIGGRPETWLQWKRDGYPEGMVGYVDSVEKAGFIPALWMGCFFTDKEIADEHPEWFVQGIDGKPFVGKWVTYVVDSTNPQAADALIRPTFRGLKNAGFKYIKIDQLRHMIYDNLNHNQIYMVKNGKRPDDIFRAYMRIAREELGNDCFILSCWGVLPESIGLADACRIGGDGYGPVTLQQYNSWNGIVWRNDPDHCDVSPRKAAEGVGNVTETKEIKAADNDTIIRPALASIAGAMLMLSDKPEIYQDDRNLVGARRSSPVLFSVPGQLYDFDQIKTDVVKVTDRASTKGGTGVSKIDGDQFGYVCPFWLNEFNKPFENWNVLHRLNWTGEGKAIAEATEVKFADLGLDPAKEYIVYEFWKNKMLGVLKDKIQLGKLEPMGLQSLAIREKLDRPQLVSTSRHLSQGAAEIEKMVWLDNAIDGRSRVIVGDLYVMTFYVPNGYEFTGAVVNEQNAKTELEGNVLKVYYLPEETGSVGWKIFFK